MPMSMRHVGLDVHAATIAVAVAEADGSVRELGVIRHRPEAVRKLVAKLGPTAQLRVCYEAGPTGYPLYRQLTALGVHCDVIAPSLVPTKAGDRVKTDRKDAVRLARTVTAATLVSELGTLRRFASPRQLMGYAGLVPREHSSGSGVHRGAITKTGNAHLRRVLVEAAWAYRHRPNLSSPVLRLRQQTQSLPVVAIATRAQQRLCTRYRRLTERGKPPLAVATTIARELLGFIWAIGQLVEPLPAAARCA